MGFEKTFRERYPLVCRLVRGFGVAPRSVEDAAQEVFIVLYRRRDEYGAGGRVPTALLYGVARRVSANYRRKEQRRRDGQSLDGRRLVALGSAADERLELASKAEVVRAALERLDEGKRCAFVMVEVEGMSVKEFAAEFGINVNTAHARLRAARQRIARDVQRAKLRERAGA
ncbi:MAG: RNA polymerase sigma factor [Nannocystaceae bacterium]|nr:sigma-70 family RNA polymerase sigma factor [bacterium]